MRSASVTGLIFSVTAIILLSVVFGGVAGPAEAGKFRAYIGGSSFSVPVTTIKEARFKTVIKQQYDFSCGAAAVATLLTFHYDRPTSEQDVFKVMFANGDKEKIRKEGFSLLDMKNYLEVNEYKADGFRISLDSLAHSRIPAIVLVQIRGYKHFVLIKGIRGDEVVVGDPAFGVKIYARAKFEKVLAGDVFFVIRTEKELARKHFNDDKDWAVRVKAPFGTALSRQELGSTLLLLPAGNEF